MAVYTYDIVLKAFEEKDCVLLTTEKEYKNLKTTLFFDCKCGRKNCKTTYENFRKPETLCRSCGAKRGRNSESYEQVQAYYKEKNCTLLEDHYINAKTKMKFTCSCPEKRVGNQSFQNFKHGFRCSHCTGRATTPQCQKKSWDEIEKIFENKGAKLLSTEEEYQNKSTKLWYMCGQCKCCQDSEGNKFIVTYGNASSDVWIGCPECSKKRYRVNTARIKAHFKEEGCKLLTLEDEYKNNKQKLNYVCICGNDQATISYKEFCEGYRCKKCKYERTKATNMRIYGVENVFQSPEIKEKIKRTMIKKYGVDHTMKLEMIVEKTKDTNRKRYNYEYRFCAPDVRAKGMKTCKERYDNEFPFRNTEIFERALKASYKLKQYCFPSGRIESVQGYEPACINYLLEEKNIPEDDIVVGATHVPHIPYFDQETNRDRIYFPDIFIPSKNLIIEVKCNYTFNKEKRKNIAKMKGCKRGGYDVCLYIFGRDKRPHTTWKLGGRSGFIPHVTFMRIN